MTVPAERRFAVAIDDVGPLMASLSAALRGSGKGIAYDDGFIVVANDAPDATLSEVAAAVGNLPAARKAALLAYAASVRYANEIAGMSVGGVAYPTDRDAQAKMTSAVLMSQVDPATTFQWKTGDGFVTLDAAGILAAARAVGGYVRACFAAEAAVVAAIAAGTVTTPAQIDAAAWPAKA